MVYTALSHACFMCALALVAYGKEDRALQFVILQYVLSIKADLSEIKIK